MKTKRVIGVASLIAMLLAHLAYAQATQPGVGRLPHVLVDVRNRQVRVECEALQCKAPLEFFCVIAGGSEHEAAIRTRAKPSDIHTALLMLGLVPGEPLKFSEAAKKWFPPHGPPVNITMEFEKDGKRVSLPAYQLMRDVKTKKPMPVQSWIFAGSRLLENGTYGADPTGYVVSIVNFEFSLLDVPRLASNADETLEWEAALELFPALGAPMTMVIEPVDKAINPAAPANPATAPATGPVSLSDVSIDQEKVDRARAKWLAEVRPHADALRHAAQAQYEVVIALRREQQRLVDEADRIQRLIDQFERDYQQMTTPRPEDAEGEARRR